MIQYKRLDEEERYRIDSQALKEIRRMEELEESLTSEPDSEYRFNDSPFFFKSSIPIDDRHRIISSFRGTMFPLA